MIQGYLSKFEIIIIFLNRIVYWLSIDWIHRRKEKKKWRNCSKSINYGHHLREFIDFCLFLLFHVRFMGQDSNKNEVVDDSRRYVFGGLWISLSCMSDNFSCMENNNYVELRSNLWWFFNNFIFLLRTFLIIITSWWYLNNNFLLFVLFKFHVAWKCILMLMSLSNVSCNVILSE